MHTHTNTHAHTHTHTHTHGTNVHSSSQLPEQYVYTELPPDFPILVDEESLTVRVQAGVVTRILLDYLANYRCVCAGVWVCVCVWCMCVRGSCQRRARGAASRDRRPPLLPLPPTPQQQTRSTAKADSGYTLPAFPWYIDQTIGGAIATGTHGSSLQWGSLSSQARARAAVRVA